MNDELRMQNVESCGSGGEAASLSKADRCRGAPSAFCILHSSFRRATRAAAVSLLCLSAASCTDWALYDLDVFWANFDMISLLRESVSYDPYEMPRLPAANTIPVASPLGDSPPPFTQQDLFSGSLPAMNNPLQPSPEVLLRGGVVYQQQCMVCHGAQGLGDGPVIGPGKLIYAPSLVTPLATSYSDEYLYAIIRVGRGLMPPYGERTSHADRWATVMYVRQLQREAGPAAAAVPAAAAPAAPAAAGAAAPPEAGAPR